MSKYQEQPLDFAGLHTVPIRVRGGKVRASDFAVPYTKGAGVRGWLDSLPRILAGDSFRALVEALARARAAGKPIHPPNPGRQRRRAYPGVRIRPRRPLPQFRPSWRVETKRF